jgi:hypothetical protein
MVRAAIWVSRTDEADKLAGIVSTENVMSELYGEGETDT